jgi:hypothetical protein
MKKLEEMDSWDRFIQVDNLDWIYRHYNKSIKAINESIAKSGKVSNEDLKFFIQTFKIAQGMKENLTEKAWNDVESSFKVVYGYVKQNKEIPNVLLH